MAVYTALEPPSPKQSRPSFMKDRSRSLQPPVDSGPSFEINQYLSQSCIPENNDVLHFWKVNENKYPTLAQLASIYLSIPASSGPVEKLHTPM